MKYNTILSYLALSIYLTLIIIIFINPITLSWLYKETYSCYNVFTAVILSLITLIYIGLIFWFE